MTVFDPEELAGMQAAFARRDRASDGRFVVGVTTTGIYCRPSCPARRPKAENTLFLPSNAEAEAAGFRPCKRCRPDEAARDAEAVRRAVAMLEAEGSAPRLSELAAAAEYSPAHFQRIFLRLTGLSPAAYGRAVRAGRAGDSLSGADRVTDAIYDAGYSSPSRFYDEVRDRLGMAPSAWRDGGRGVTIHWAQVSTTLGPMLVAATDKGVCRLSFGEGVEALQSRFSNARLERGGSDFETLLTRIVAVVERPGMAHDIPLDVAGTAFQERVWQELRNIPPGETRSYAQLAAAAGNDRASRAAGSANGANPVSVLVPCHRVIRGDGSIGGYAWGLDIKRELLRRERG